MIPQEDMRKKNTLDETKAQRLRRGRRKFVRLAGKIDFRDDWDYKAARRRSRA